MAASSAATSSRMDLSPLAAFRRLLDLGLHRLEVGEGQLDLEHPEVLERVVGTGHVGVGEGPQHIDDGVDLADAGEEPVAEPLALAGPLDETADVGELHARRYHALGTAHRGQGVEPLVEHLGHARRWGRWWRRRTARRARRHPRGRCRARTSPRWEGRRSRIVPSLRAYWWPPDSLSGPLAR
jgi:hypothetical protein